MRACISTCASVLLGALLVGDAGARDDVRSPLPAQLAFRYLDGSAEIAPGRLCGPVVALEFVSSDCAACAHSLHELDLLRATLPREELAPFAVLVDDELATARAFAAGQAIETPVLWDANRRAVEALSIRGVPTTLVIDRRGRVAERIEGYSGALAERLRARIGSLAREPRPRSC